MIVFASPQMLAVREPKLIIQWDRGVRTGGYCGDHRADVLTKHHIITVRQSLVRFWRLRWSGQLHLLYSITAIRCEGGQIKWVYCRDTIQVFITFLRSNSTSQEHRVTSFEPSNIKKKRTSVNYFSRFSLFQSVVVKQHAIS